MDYVEAHQQRYAQTAVFYGNLLQVGYSIYILEVENTADFAFAQARSHIAFGNGSGVDVTGTA